MDSMATKPDVPDGDPRAVPGLFPGGGRGDGEASVDAVSGGEAWLEGAAWQIGGPEQVLWIADHTEPGLSIVSAIPAIFDAYATVIVPEEDRDKRLSDSSLLALLRAHSSNQPWWLGYLETGASDVVFPDAARVRLYSGWSYVLVKGGPDQAASWRTNVEALPWLSALPELMFPLDHSWLVSTLWDDDWRCVGGSTSLVAELLQHPQIEAREVALCEDAAPPGHRAQ